MEGTMGGTMEEPGEQCTVVFALIGTESASECVVGGEGGGGDSSECSARDWE
jgi:hypothetical protein